MSLVFQKSRNFCAVCGTLLPPLLTEYIQCRKCKTTDRVKPRQSDGRKRMKAYKIPMKKKDADDSEEKTQGGVSLPVVERQCKECGNGEMYFHTQQTRSADEGQTVFYTCTECGIKELEYS